MLKLRSESFKRKKNSYRLLQELSLTSEIFFTDLAFLFFLQSLWQVISILTFSEGPQEVFWNPGFPFN